MRRTNVSKDILNFWDKLTAAQKQSEETNSIIIEAFAITKALVETIPNLDIDEPHLAGNPYSISKNIIDTYIYTAKKKLSEARSLLKASQLTEKYKTKFSNGFVYEFSEGDLNKVQTLINELRESISDSDIFEEDHKTRLLARLEKVQSELHKKMADLDKFWGLVGDAGVALGKLGNDAKPFVDRIKEITNIIWRTQSRAEELPSDSDSPILLPQEVDNE